jgi:segregation and condensation protein B
MKGLIQEIGRAETPGRPILYSATTECMQYFGLNSLADLPPLDLEKTQEKETADNLLKG